MSRPDDFAGLNRLTAARFRAAQAEMAGLSQRAEELRAKLEQLVAGRAAQAATPRPASDPALVAGADLRWHRWVDQRRAAINAELAQVLARTEACRARLAQAFGRDQAAQCLLKKADAMRKQEMLRRARY